MREIDEQGLLAIIRLNQICSRKEISITHKLGRIQFNLRWRSKDNLWGRFGGGWNWEFGFVAGGHTIIFNLLIFSIRIEYKTGKC